jgi:hypothetical protein
MRAERAAPPAQLVAALCAAVAIAYGLWAWLTGIQTAPDTSTYSRWADLLIAHRFNVFAYVRDQSFVVPPILYVLWIAVVAALKVLLGASWMVGAVALNWLSLAGGVYATLATARRLTGSSAGLLLATLLFLVAADLLVFVPFVLSDLLFWGLSTIVLAAAMRLVISDGEGDGRECARLAVTGCVLVAVAMAFRPAALPLVVFWVATLLAWVGRPLLDRFGGALFASAAAFTGLAMAVHAYVLMHPSAWPFGELPGMLALLSQEYRAGVLVYAPGSHLSVEPATAWLGAVRLTLQKLMYFFAPWLPHYGTAHSMMNIAFFAPAYGLSIAAAVNGRRLEPAQHRAVWLLALFVLFVSAFHAMLQIDYDHRYRLPVLPALILLAAIGLASLRRRISA